MNDDVLLSFQLQIPFNYLNVPYYILLGVLAGLISIYHARIFTKIEGLFSNAPKKKYLNVFIGGIALAILLFIFPSLFGEGYQSIKLLSTQHPENLLDNSILQSLKSNQWIVLDNTGNLCIHFYI